MKVSPGLSTAGLACIVVTSWTVAVPKVRLVGSLTDTASIRCRSVDPPVLAAKPK